MFWKNNLLHEIDTWNVFLRFYGVIICRVNIEHVQLPIAQESINTFNDNNNCKQYDRGGAHAFDVAFHATTLLSVNSDFRPGYKFLIQKGFYKAIINLKVFGYSKLLAKSFFVILILLPYSL